MANYATLKAAIQAVIYENGNQEITGEVMQATLLSMVNSLGANFQYAGIATPNTDPGTPDQNVFYLAATAGTYANFGNIVLEENEVAILKYNGAWAKDVSGIASADQVKLLGQELGLVDIDVDIVAQEGWKTGRVLISISADANYSYIKFSASAGEKITYRGVCDANTCFLGYGDDNAQKTILVHGVGSSAWVEGSITAPVDGTYWFCVYTAGVSGSTLTIGRKKSTLSDMRTEIENLQDAIGREDETTPTITTQDGYISNVGAYNNAASYRVTSPIHLGIGDTLKATLSAPVSLAVFSKTQNIANVTERTHDVVLYGLESWVTHEYTYTADEDCYIEISYLNATSLTNVKVISINNIEKHSIEIEQLNDFVKNEIPYDDLMLKTLCIGDSLTEGCEYDENAQLVNTRIAENYPYYLQRMSTLEVTNEGHSGATPTSLINGVHARLLTYDFTPFDNFIIWLGTNDGLTDTLDVDVIPYSDWNNYANTNTGNYCKIISCIISQVPKAKIFLGSVFATNGDKTVTNAVIDKIAALYPANVMGVVNNDDGTLKFVGAEWDLWYHNHPQQIHFSKVGNFVLARHWLIGIRQLIKQRLGDFRNHLLTP